MGYGIHNNGNSLFTISAANVQRARADLKIPANPHLSPLGRLTHWASCGCWELWTKDGASVSGISFVGEKSADYMEQTLRDIAPFVEPESFIEMRGDEGEVWRWVFRDGKVWTVTPKITVDWTTSPVLL